VTAIFTERKVEMFELPDTFQKELSPSTQKVYKRYLNNLASAGIDTVDKLKKSRAVIKAIKDLTANEDAEKSKTLARFYISAIFWVAPLPKGGPYYKLYQKNLPAKAGDKVWLPKRDFDNAS
jgi:hypothetical protein